MFRQEFYYPPLFVRGGGGGGSPPPVVSKPTPMKRFGQPGFQQWHVIIFAICCDPPSSKACWRRTEENITARDL